MGDAHEVVVDHVGEVVGGEAVGLDQYHVVELSVVHGDVAIDFVVEDGGAGGGAVLAHHVGLASVKVGLHLLGAEAKAVLVVDGDLLAGDGLLEALQAAAIAEAIVGLALGDELLGVIHVKARGHSLALDVGAEASVLVGALVMHEACAC